MSPGVLDYFSENDIAARNRFRAEAAELGRKVPGFRSWSFQVPSASDPDLHVDYALYGGPAKAKRLIVIVSGIHGVEGFAGSAIQSMFLRELAPGIDFTENRLLIVHAMNPFGMRYGRRATENNVNLNRNFSTDPALYQTKNGAYLRLRDSLEPKGPLRSLSRSWRRIARRMFSLLLTGRATLRDLEQAIGQGQYVSPAGLEYGGAAAEPQVRNFLQRLSEAAADVEELILFDLHTGLGHKSVLHLLPGDGPRSVDPNLFARLFRPDEEQSIYSFTPNDTAGFYHTSGDLNQAVSALISSSQRAVALTLEYGTVGNGVWPKLSTLNRIIAENQGFQFGYSSPAVQEEVRRAFAELFFPREAEWREAVIAKARRLFAIVIERLG